MAKVMISVSDDLLAQVDAEVERRSMTRSAFLAAAARRELSRRDPEAMREAIHRSEERFARHGNAFESAELIRRERDSR